METRRHAVTRLLVSLSPRLLVWPRPERGDRRHGGKARRRCTAASSAGTAAGRSCSSMAAACGCCRTLNPLLGQRPIDVDPQLARPRPASSFLSPSSTICWRTAGVEIGQRRARSTDSTAPTARAAAARIRHVATIPCRAFQADAGASCGSARDRQMTELSQRRHIELSRRTGRRLAPRPAQLRRAPSCRSRRSAGIWS